MMVTLNQKNFDDFVESNEICLIEFWSTWCKPCHIFSDTIGELASQFPTIQFAKVNVEEEKALAHDFKIKSVPTTFITKAGVIAYRDEGVLMYSVLEDLLEQAKQL